MRANNNTRFPYVCSLREYISKDYTNGCVQAPEYVKIEGIGPLYSLKLKGGYTGSQHPTTKVYLQWRVAKVTQVRVRKMLKGWKIVVNLLGQPPRFSHYHLLSRSRGIYDKGWAKKRGGTGMAYQMDITDK